MCNESFRNLNTSDSINCVTLIIPMRIWIFFPKIFKTYKLFLLICFVSFLKVKSCIQILHSRYVILCNVYWCIILCNTSPPASCSRSENCSKIIVLNCLRNSQKFSCCTYFVQLLFSYDYLLNGHIFLLIIQVKTP